MLLDDETSFRDCRVLTHSLMGSGLRRTLAAHSDGEECNGTGGVLTGTDDCTRGAGSRHGDGSQQGFAPSLIDRFYDLDSVLKPAEAFLEVV